MSTPRPDDIPLDVWSAAEEFCTAHGIGILIAPDKSDRARFIDWLDDRAHDHAARREVEAA